MNPSLPPPNVSLHRTLLSLLILMLVGMFAYFILDATRKIREVSSVTLPTYDVITPFTLTECRGRMVTEKDLLGKICVVDFIFSTCPGPCPFLSQKMQHLQGALEKMDNIRLISFTVDPETDTPDILRAYAEKYSADPNKWWFLTGSSAVLQHLVEKVFRLPLTRNPDEETPKVGRFLHSTRFVLVDAKGCIRGYYNSYNTDGNSRQDFEHQLLRDINLVKNEEGL